MKYFVLLFAISPLILIGARDLDRAIRPKADSIALAYWKNPEIKPLKTGVEPLPTTTTTLRPALRKPDFMNQAQWDYAVAKADEFGADPYLIAAIAQHETGCGRLGAGRYGYHMGVGVPSSGKRLKQFAGWENQVNWATPRMGKHIGTQVDHDKIWWFGRNVWKPDNPKAWADGVWKVYRKIR